MPKGVPVGFEMAEKNANTQTDRITDISSFIIGIDHTVLRARIDLVKFLFFESAFCAVLPYFEKTETIENSEFRPRNYM